MEVRINGRAQALPRPMNLVELLDFLGLKPDRCAIELNRSLVSRAKWQEIVVNSNDELEVVHFVGGG